ncbi:MAG: phosphodiester glycosidase family protein [Bacteroidetes bacterium]|nr:phosphodiester glycosidase family protein [Bacteroidota bacterium]
MKRWIIFCISILFSSLVSQAQWQWKNVDSLYQPLPKGVHVYKTADETEGKPNIAFYVSADLHEKSLQFATQTGNGKRLTPTQYYEQEKQPMLVMNTTFFEFVHNSNLNVVIKDGSLRAYQVHTLPLKGKDTLTYRHVFGSAIGISRKRRADVAWLYTDSAARYAYASQQPVKPWKDSIPHHSLQQMLQSGKFSKWKMETAVGGGPVLVQNGAINITNNEELKFAGKAINDKHPRSAMGYTADGLLIFLAIEGRFPGKAEGATLTQTAKMLQQIGCIEALNLDGGGSSCLLVNGKQTITPSDKEGQRAVPAVFVIKTN